jgi:hypothetical protein
MIDVDITSRVVSPEITSVSAELGVLIWLTEFFTVKVPPAAGK